MTTGSQIEDHRQVVNTSAGSGIIGSYFARSWSGADSPKREKTVYDKQFYYLATDRPPTPRYNVVRYRKVNVRRLVKVVSYTTVRVKVRLPDGKLTHKYKRVPYESLKWVRAGKRFEKYNKTVGGKPRKSKITLKYTKVARPKPRREHPQENPYTCNILSYRDSLGSTSRRVYPIGDTNSDRTTGDCTTLNMLGGPGTVNTWSSNDDLVLLQKLRSRVAGSDFNLGVFLAEGKQALGMIINAASKIYKAYSALQRGNIAGAAKALVGTSGGTQAGIKPGRDLASHWLELQYGWLPLVQDAEAGAQFLAHMNSYPQQRTVTVSRKAAFRTTWDDNPGYEPIAYLGSRTVRIKAIIREVDRAQLVGLTDVASIVWEKLPFSFVADWFIPIGSFLSARGLAQALTGTFVTTRVDRVAWAGCNQRPGSGGTWDERVTFGPFYYRSLDMVRTVSSTLEVPMPRVKPLRKAATWLHTANAVALLTQLGPKLQNHVLAQDFNAKTFATPASKNWPAWAAIASHPAIR